MSRKTLAHTRHHEERVKAKRRKYFVAYDRNDPRCVGRIARTPKPCSCYACGNERRHFGEPTMQEKRAAEAFR